MAFHLLWLFANTQGPVFIHIRFSSVTRAEWISDNDRFIYPVPHTIGSANNNKKLYVDNVHLVNTAFIRMLAKRRSLLLLLADKPVK